MRFPKDLINRNVYVKPNFYLCETDKTKIAQLNTTETKASFKFNACSELSFEIGRVYNDSMNGNTKVNPYYSKIEAPRLIYIEGFGYFEIQSVEIVSDGIKETKNITAKSLEYTLSTKYLEEFYINMGTVSSKEVIAAEDPNNITPVTLYNLDKPELSLLHLVFAEVYGWNIGHVDARLQTLGRQFEISRETVYDFLMNEVCEKFNCYIIFDTISNTVNVYAESLTAKFIGDGITKSFIITPPFINIGTVSIDGYRTTKWEYNYITGELKLDEAPAAGAHIEAVDGALTGWETDVFVTFDNLSQEINISYDADEIKTKLNVVYGDDGDIREVNLGLPYLTDLSYFYTVDWMGQDLYDAYTRYLQKNNECQTQYTDNAQKILKLQNDISFENNRLSLVYGMDSSVNEETVGTYYIISGGDYPNYYYDEVSLPSDYIAGRVYYRINNVNISEEKVDTLYSAIRKYFVHMYGQVEPEIRDIATKEGTYEDLLNELSDNNQFHFVDDAFNEFKSKLTTSTTAEKATTVVKKFLDLIWKELGATPLKEMFLKPYQEVQRIHIDAGYSQRNSEYYWFYYPVTIMIETLEAAIAERNKTISDLNKQLTIHELDNQRIAESLLMKNNFSEGQLMRLNAFIREDELTLSDIIETDLDDIEGILKVKRDAMESGRIELQKICQPQLKFSMTMANIYALLEFEPIVNQFQLGNVIRVGLRPDYIKQSRLLQVDINFDDFSDFSVEFGELSSLRSQSDIHADLLKNAITAGKSVATHSSYWTKGSDIATSTDLKIQQGLLDATTQIKAIDGTQGVIIDKYGILLTKIDPTMDTVSPKQARIVNNMILMTDDNWKTSQAGLGEFTVDGLGTFYGLIAKAVIAGYIEGSTLVGGEIRSSNYISGQSGTYFDLNGGDFEIAGGNLVYNTSSNSLSLKNVTIEWSSTNAPTLDIEDVDGLQEYIGQIEQIESQLDNVAETWYQSSDPSVAWETQDAKVLHVGDLWHYTGETDSANGVQRIKNSEWIWQEVNGNYQWVAIEISDAVFDAIDGKAQIFTSQPTSYSKGDLIIPVETFTADNITYYERCVYTAITTSSSFSSSDWTSLDYTNDKELLDFINGNYTETIESIRFDIDGKADTYYQSSAPHDEHTNVSDTTEYNSYIGDLWYDTDSGKTYIYQKIQSTADTYNYTWEYMSIPTEVFDAIDGISSIYVIMPTDPVIGDLLIPASDVDGYKAGKVYRYNGSTWNEIAYTDDTAANEAKAEVGKLDSQVAQYFGLDGTTIMGNNYVISPYLGGGYLNITNVNNKNARVIIDPNNITENGYIFQIHYDNKVVMGVNTDGDAAFNGTITAGRGEIAGLTIGTQGIRYCGGVGNGVGIWKGDIHKDDLNDDYIVFHAGLDYDKESLVNAPFKIFQTGKLKIGSFGVSREGALQIGTFNVSKDGAMEATTGKIAGWELDERSLKGTYNGDVVRLYPEKIELTKADGTVDGITWEDLLARVTALFA